MENVWVHAFTDGRDCDPKSGLAFLQNLEQHCAATTGKIASVVGRYYAMDRDNRWERVKVAYDAMVNGIGTTFTNLTDAIEASYAKGITDEFIEPLILADSNGNIEDGDTVICFNFRTDRPREITDVLTQRAFPEFDMKPLQLQYFTMTNYDVKFKKITCCMRKKTFKTHLEKSSVKWEERKFV